MWDFLVVGLESIKAYFKEDQKVVGFFGLISVKNVLSNILRCKDNNHFQLCKTIIKIFKKR